MSNGTKVGIAVVILLVIAGGIWYAKKQSANAPSMDNATYSASPQNSDSMVNSTTTITTTSSNDTSNTAINQDMTNINGQMNGLQNDSANTDQSVNQ